jgi:arabinogalactan oligomer/maltooligosaccharide transport system substrate-binding protein
MKKVLIVALGAILSLAMAQNKLTVWTSFNAGELEWLKVQAAKFEKTAGVKVELVEVPFGDIQQKFILGAPQGQAADLIAAIPHDRVGELAAAGVLEPMDKYATSSYLGSLSESAIDGFSYKGKLFGLPVSAEAVALIYNKKLVPNAPKTWDEFLKVAQDNTKGNSFGFLYDLGNAYFNYGWIKAYGGSIFGRTANGGLDENKVMLGGEGGSKSIGFMKDLRYKYKLIPEGVDYGVADSAFKEGALAMIINGPWAIGDYKKAKIDFGIAALPTPPGGSTWRPFVGVFGLVMNAYSKNKTAAANFAKTLVSANNQISFNQASGRIPVSKDAVTKLKNDPVVAGFSPLIAIGEPMPNIPQMGKVWGPWGNGISQAIQKADTNVDKIVTDMVAEIQKGISGK